MYLLHSFCAAVVQLMKDYRYFISGFSVNVEMSVTRWVAKYVDNSSVKHTSGSHDIHPLSVLSQTHMVAQCCGDINTDSKILSSDLEKFSTICMCVVHR